ncbi:SGNH/GDSL hydrolase family protein [Arthrobacter cavernae]|uniref:SGNH/GDSL hydrolase family protein n=1 Tax=Arthrobacter cavernae TaxID=2817681 RepID=A0A939HEE3_9MICC|nr:SGNH/GDSL hydrolase family protein [Arthrobacter cavernae]MBO1267679.1 SGNH/GDSL hydrolase family protein [Arthrobacter cavernae]
MKVLNARRRPLALAASVATVALAFGLSGAPAQAAPVSPLAEKQPEVYVALGDSYAAGTGGGTAVPSPLPPLDCKQTSQAYPALLDGTNLGCFGATTGQVAGIATLSAAVLGQATEVTITAGGNDAGVGAVTAFCVAAPFSPACAGAIAAVPGTLPDVQTNVADLVDYVQTLAPNADVVVTGYPRLFTVSGMDPSLQPLATQLNDMADKLNAAVKAGAAQAGVPFVDVTSRFNGHGIGSDAPWINFDGNPLNTDNFHPNAAGYNNGYRTAVNAALKK